MNIIYLRILICLFCFVEIRAWFNKHNEGVTEIYEEGDSSSVGGFWQVKKQWKAYWVKDWKIKKMVIPTWKKVWGPVEVNEWVPLAKPAPTLEPQIPLHK